MKKKLIVFIAMVLLSAFALTGCGSAAPVLLAGGILPTRRMTESRSQETDTGAPAQIIDLSDPAMAAENETTDAVSDANASGFSITMLDVGQGLALAIQADGYTVLYDGGPQADAAAQAGSSAAGQGYPVMEWLQAHQVECVDLMISSHYDADHTYGLEQVLDAYPVKTALCGNYNDKTEVCRIFLEKLKKSGAETIHPEVGETYVLGGLQVQILSPRNYEYEDENNYSIAVRLGYGDFHCVITGDAQAEAEQDMLASGLDLSADLYVCGHHGSSTSSGEEFVKAISPRYAFISCGWENDYGQPSEKTLDTLKAAGVQLFRTDTQGTVTCTGDGKAFTFDQQPTDNWEPGVYVPQASETPSVSATSDVSEYKYILNTNTMKIHWPTCDSVQDMSEKNKQGTNESIENLKAQGYKPCKRCNPN